MKKILILIILFSVIPLQAEYLFLKDGTIIKCKVIEETAAQATIKNEKDIIEVYPHNKIIRILYTELKMGKIYVQLKSGENFRGYMIDEDRDSYTFRNVINKPEEFTLKREDVLFIAERNPSGLKGESSYSEISLNWFQPYDKMKYFNIYYKKNQEDKYILAGTSGSNSYQLKGLHNNTKYFIKVTGVDDTGFETMPSNELKINTYARVDVQLKDGKIFKTNLVAEDIDKYTFRDDLNKIKDYSIKRSDVLYITERYPSRLIGTAGTDTIYLKWFEPYDSMIGYNIYIKKKGEEIKTVLSVRSNSYTIDGLAGNMEYTITVTGIRTDKTETIPSRELKIKTFARVEVQLKDGKIFKTNLVAEDMDKYTFRDDLNKIKDYTIKRSDVHFITERYPTGLKGIAGTDSISLKWLEPYDPMIEYNIYIKKKGEEYKLASTSRDNFYTMKGLLSLIEYTIKITGIRRDKTETLPSNEIKITTFARVDVQLKDGKAFKTYLIAEDMDKYTFRDDLNKIKDYSIKRSDVLFITDRYPTGLKSETDYTDINLKWTYPYDEMKYYNIYLRKDKEDKYKIVGTTKSNSYRLKNLSSNTKYFIKVTGVDYNYTGTETAPSNEITVSTLNRAPYMPTGLKVTQPKTGGTDIEWKPAVDPDGVVVKYKIYKIIKNKKELAGETKDTSYKITGKAAIDRIVVTAVDDMGAESSTYKQREKQKVFFHLYITPAVLFPIDIFGTMGNIGFGGTLSFMVQNLFVNGFTLGVEFGYFYTLGINSIETTWQNIHAINIVTGSVKAGYSFQVTDFFFITPALFIGAGYIDMIYTLRSPVTLIDTEKTAMGVDPMAGVSLSLDFIISKHFLIGINASYGMFFESKRVIQFVSCGINLGARF